ncbi:MAG: hypothetical protein GEV05_16285 [Betaproteobacteria bacterium]|nr:hypothetical protein [Betaproteobacteria bacterium]
MSNGLLLRSDLHKLFDLGYITVTPELRLEGSARLREEWCNRREYYSHHGKALVVEPTKLASRARREFLPGTTNIDSRLSWKEDMTSTETRPGAAMTGSDVHTRGRNDESATVRAVPSRRA